MTSDEKWILCSNVERKRPWAANEPPHATPKAGLHAGKAVCVCGVSPLLRAPSKHQMIHSSKHCSRLDQMKALLDRKHPELVNRKHRIFHQDKARPRVSLTTRQKLSQPGWEVLSHPPCSPDTAPSVSHLFRSSQNSVNGRNLNSLEDCRDTWNSSLLKKIKFWKDGSMKLPERWQKVVEQKGEYVVE